MSKFSPTTYAIAGLLSSCLVFCTTGCSTSFSSPVTPAATTTHASIVGTLHGGQQGISGATIQLYAAGEPTNLNGLGLATPLIHGTLPLTDANGNFNITGDYALPIVASHFYIVANGGSAGNGLPANSHISLMATLSGCNPTLALSPTQFITINEVTTVAAAMALQPFFAPPAAFDTNNPLIGTPLLDYTGMQNGFEEVNNLVNISNGTAYTHAQNFTTSDSNALSIYSMANTLASCVNSVTSSSQCSQLGSFVTPPGQSFVANDPIQAAFYIAQNPTNNVPSIFALGGSSPPFVGLTSAPSTFAVTTSTANSACQLGVSLGLAANYAVLGGSTVANTSTAQDPTVITGGDVGVSPGLVETGFVAGASTAVIDNVDALLAKVDLATAYTTLSALSGAAPLPSDVSNLTLPPGLYSNSTALSLNTGTLILDAQGDANAVFIFQVGSTFTLGAGTKIILENGAAAKNVFWQIGSSAIVGAGAAVQGNLLAATSVSLGKDATLVGRALAQTQGIDLISNQITVPQ
jgi:hypothetical protein